MYTAIGILHDGLTKQILVHQNPKI